MTWDPESQPDDYARVDGKQAPGVCTITKFTKKRRLQKIEPHGSLGARTICLGEYLVEWAFTITLASAKDWEAWAPFSKVLDRIPIGKNGKAASIEWAPFSSRGVRAVMIEVIEGPLPSDDGAWHVTISGCSWVPIPKLALSAPKEEQKPTPSNDRGDVIIERLVQQVIDHPFNRRR